MRLVTIELSLDQNELTQVFISASITEPQLGKTTTVVDNNHNQDQPHRFKESKQEEPQRHISQEIYRSNMKKCTQTLNNYNF